MSSDVPPVAGSVFEMAQLMLSGLEAATAEQSDPGRDDALLRFVFSWRIYL